MPFQILNTTHTLEKRNILNVSLFKDIRFWIVFFFLIRLVGITNPPLENAHDWRQCLTNMMSRNLYETDNNPFYPRVDNGGKHDGIIASEFPVYNYVVYLISLLFGYAHWYGRLVNLIISSLAVWYFYKLLKYYLSEKVAFTSAFLLTISIWFTFSRKTMPDIFSISMMIMALYQVFTFIKTYNWWRLALFGILASIAVLAKLPAIYALSILGLIILNGSSRLLPKFSVILAAVFVFSVGYWWYFVWGEYLLKTWEYQLYFPKNYKEGPPEFLATLGMAAERFYFSAFQSFIAFGMFVVGLYIAIRKKQRIPLYILGITFPVFLIFIVKTGNVFALHSYYVIPFVPVMCIIAAVGLSSLPPRFYAWVLCLIAIESIANQQHEFFVPDSEKFKLNLETEINKSVPANTKIVLSGTTGPQYLYFAHRKGWGVSPEQTLDTAYMNFVQSKGYRYLVVIKKELDSALPYTKISEDSDIVVYDMKGD